MKYLSILLFLCLSYTTALAHDIENSKGKKATILSNSDLIDSVLVYSTTGTNSRYSYTYDSNGNMLSYKIEQLQNSQWVNYQLYTYTFDLNDNPLSMVYQLWQNGQWENSERETNTYDSYGNNLTWLQESWYSGQWTAYAQGIYTYDTSLKKGCFLTGIRQEWNNGQWDNVFRYTETYDTKSNLLADLYEEWQNGQWVNFEHQTFNRDSNGNILSDFDEKWQNGQWANSEKETCTYDSIGNQLTDMWEVWNSGQWVGYERMTYTYDLNRNKLNNLWEKWQNGNWVNLSRYSYFYDKNDNLHSDLGEIWKNGQWVNSDSTTNTFNYIGYVLTKYYEIWDTAGQWKETDAPLDFKDSKGRDFAFQGYKIEVIYQGPTTVNEANNFTFALNCSPNPASGIINIDYTLTEPQTVSFIITNSLGIEVANLKNGIMQIPGNYSFNYDASNLAPGVYFLTIRAGNKTETKKFVAIR